MKIHAQRWPCATPLALATTASVLLSGCLGGSSEDPFKPNPENPTTPAVTAASCFDNALNYTVGNTITLEYTNFAITTAALQPAIARIQVISNTASFEGQTNLLQINNVRGSILSDLDNAWQTESNTYVVRPSSNTAAVTTAGTVSKTILNSASASADTITTVYNPAITDQRRTLEIGQSLNKVLSGTEKTLTPATNNQAAVETSRDFTTTQNITFINKENLTVGSQSVEACRFKTSVVGQPDITEWVYRGLTIRTEINGQLTEQVTAFASSAS